MSDSDLEKTEQASPRRLEKAREDGQTARSRELATFALLLAGVGGIWWSSGLLYQMLSGVLRNSLGFDRQVAFDTAFMRAQAGNGVWHALQGVAPLMGLLVVVAIAASVALGGILFTAKPLEPDLSKLSPLKGLKRIFSANTLVELAKTIVKALLVGGIAAWTIWYHLDSMLLLMHEAPGLAMPQAMQLVLICCVTIISSLILIALFDSGYQVWNHAKKLRMSRQEVRDENKDSEGDPHVKGRIRQQQRAMAQRRMMSEVPKADVVIVNPTHYAVALTYREGELGAPRVVAKGAGLIAARIRELAIEHRVPLLHAPPLARALNQHVELGHEIPTTLYTAVAEVLAWVFQLRSWRTAGGNEPKPPANLPVPAELDPGPAK